MTIVHFNASVSGWNGIDGFIYPNSITSNFFLENRLYLGSIGVSLFFMLSGVTLMMTYKQGDLKRYYGKRIQNIFPMFWIAYAIAFAFDFLRWKGMSIANIKLWFFSLIGMDGYLGCMGLIGMDFYKLGEWFLGCLLLLYLIFPLLHYGVEKSPIFTTIFVFSGYALYMLGSHFWGWKFDDKLFFLRIPELILGMLFVKYDLRNKPKRLLAITGLAAWLAIILRKILDPLTLLIGVCVFLFALLVCIGEKINNASLKETLTKLAGLTYPVFLVHHWLIDRMVIGFDLANMNKRTVAMLFVIYIVLSFFLAYQLKRYSDKLVSYVKNLFKG